MAYDKKGHQPIRYEEIFKKEMNTNSTFIDFRTSSANAYQNQLAKSTSSSSDGKTRSDAVFLISIHLYTNGVYLDARVTALIIIYVMQI